MALYTCYTDCGKWDFEAYNDQDAIRLALYYCWEWDSKEDFARHIVEECYNLELEIAEYLLNKLNMKQKMMGSLANYFDYEAFARALFDWDYTMGANGHVFRRVWPSDHSESRAFPKEKALFAI